MYKPLCLCDKSLSLHDKLKTVNEEGGGYLPSCRQVFEVKSELEFGEMKRPDCGQAIGPVHTPEFTSVYMRAQNLNRWVIARPR
jgi:hypothetical protein